MDNVTESGYTDHTQFMVYEVSVLMWKVLPPIILVLGTFGNLATILVMSRIKNNNSSQYVLLMVLAMADLCVLYFGLLTAWLRDDFNVYVENIHIVLCKIYYWAIYTSNTTSAWLVTTVTVQRTMAVLWPHRMRVMCTVGKTRLVVTIVVVTAISVHIHMMFGFHLMDTKQCFVSGKYMWFIILIWQWVDMCASSLVPSTFLLMCSVILSWTLFKSASLSSSATSNDSTAQSHDGRKSDAVKVTVMVLALSCTFLILTVPVCIYLLWFQFGYVYTPKRLAVSEFFRILTHLMWYSNSAVNFLLYCITGARFRKEFITLLRCGPKGHTVGMATAITLSGGGAHSGKAHH